MLKTFINTFFITLFFCATAYGQGPIKQAEHLIQKRLYPDALKILNELPDIENDGQSLKLRGDAYYYSNDLHKAILDYTLSKKKGNDDPHLFYMMGKSKHHQKAYEEAIFFYKSYINQIDKNSREAADAYREIKNAVFGMSHKDSSLVVAQNFGKNVNTIYDDLRVIQSRQYGNVYYISSNIDTEFFRIRSHIIDSLGQWSSQPVLFKDIKSNQISQDVSPDGNTMILTTSNSEGQSTDVYLSIYSDGENKLVPLPKKYFESAIDLQIVNHNTIAYASDRNGGYGGYDIYYISYGDNGWNEPVNAGARINSVYDERSPWYAEDMSTLFFSAARPYSHGGFDIYKAQLIGPEVSVKLLGENINSTANELGYRVAADGQVALMYSDRKSGFGGYDTYFVYQVNYTFDNYVDSLNLAYTKDYLKGLKYQDINSPEITAETNETLPDSFINITPDPSVIKDTILKTEYVTPVAPPDETKYQLFYQDRQDLLNDNNKLKIDHWVHYLQQNNDLNIRLIAHTDHNEPGLPEFVHYNTLKRALNVKEYLVRSGVAKERIFIESVANNYPIIKLSSSGNINSDVLYLNKRIDFEIVDQFGESISSYFPDEGLPDYVYDRRHELFQTIRDEVYYTVEIASSERMFKNAVLRLYSDIFVRQENQSETYRYFIGIYPNVEDAQQLQKELANSSAPYSRVVAIANGALVNNDNLKILSQRYPELKTFVVP